MDHLGLPEHLQSTLHKIPYLGKSPPYDWLGFENFPERCGIDSEQLLSLSSRDMSPESNHPLNEYSNAFIESLMQEWLWFGMLHEFEIACGHRLDRASLIETDGNNERVLSTKSLLGYVRYVVCCALAEAGVPLDARVGGNVLYRCLPGVQGADTTYQPGEPLKVTEVFSNSLVIVNNRRETPISLASLMRPNQTDHDATYKSEGHNRFLLTSLCQVLRTIKQSMKSDDEAHDQNKSHDRLVANLKEIETINHKLFNRRDAVLSFETSLSIYVLQFTLINSWNNMHIVNIAKQVRNNRLFDEFRHEMIRRNWCPTRIEKGMLAGKLSAYVASRLPSYVSESHAICDGYDCEKKISSVERMIAKHHNLCNHVCEDFVVSQNELIRILQSGGNPGLRRRQNKAGFHEPFEIVDVKKHQYVAISHVWSHGLGNAKNNALPSCQINFLLDLIQGLLSGDQVLWIDTISVPIDETWKRKAILKLREVYRRATVTLVLDQALQQVGPSMLERKLQLIGSEWLTRLWTLQEQQLSSNLYIQYKDEAVPLTELLADEMPFELQDDHEVLHGLLQQVSRAVRPRFPVRPGFMHLAVILTKRSVTVASDEPICLATLLGLELDNFEHYPTMTDIYNTVSQIPADFIFFPGPRMNAPGFGWAPRSFLGSRMRMFHTESSSGVLRLPYGFQINKDCIILQNPVTFTDSPSIFKNELYIRDARRGYFQFGCNNLNSDITVGNTAIILMEKIDESREKFAAVIVNTVFWEESVMYCKFGIVGELWRVNNFTQSILGVVDEKPGSSTLENAAVGEIRNSTSICIR